MLFKLRKRSGRTINDTTLKDDDIRAKHFVVKCLIQQIFNGTCTLRVLGNNMIFGQFGRICLLVIDLLWNFPRKSQRVRKDLDFHFVIGEI